MNRRRFEKYGIIILLICFFLYCAIKGIGLFIDFIADSVPDIFSSLSYSIRIFLEDHIKGIIVIITLCIIIGIVIAINNYKTRIKTKEEFQRKAEEKRIKQEEEKRIQELEEKRLQEESKLLAEKKEKERLRRKIAREKRKELEKKRLAELQRLIEEKRKLEEERALERIRIREEEERKRLEKEYQCGYKDDMTGYEYEQYCADLFNYFSWNAETTKKSGDCGGDVVAKKEGIKIIAQCKHYKGKVGIDAVKEVYLSKTIYGADYAIVITNSDYTRQAKKAAKDAEVVLLRHPDLEDWLKTILDNKESKEDKE